MYLKLDFCCLFSLLYLHVHYDLGKLGLYFCFQIRNNEKNFLFLGVQAKDWAVMGMIDLLEVYLKSREWNLLRLVDW